MAEFNSYLLGKARRSVDNITLCYTKGKNIAKAKVFARKDNPTPVVLVQRAKMKIPVQLFCQLLPVIKKGFVGIGKRCPSNAFTARNMASVSVDEKYVATVDFEQMRCAAGMLYTSNVSVSFEAQSQTYTLKWLRFCRRPVV